MDHKPVYIFAKWQVKAGMLDQVLQLLAQAARRTAEEQGNLFYKIHQSSADAHTLILFEGYTDETAVKAHRDSDYFKNTVIGQIVPALENREVIQASQLDLH
jgi:autoinducer 2-degrading protein